MAVRGVAFQDITDPVVWQREIRKDRPLPAGKINNVAGQQHRHLRRSNPNLPI